MAVSVSFTIINNFLYSDCGITNPVSPLPMPISKIVNGMDSDVGMFPWQVQFVYAFSAKYLKLNFSF